ncbi:hypothetical protein NCCP2716_21890 [Sporosarcina sp. NCCP-2716]|uniref:TIGR04104 family putative zinc finger protein n=1 Tax=Sporosarcina sp. NCCP-2716 TaxID=2943679 RepID=UPI002041C26A|nr:TIGR04104 family putative zinc finger protein [Sporosarcina sp. NCCP-2716]GKV69691.1 hypothetical protein NCCP2716_21890 [Sporosarcina sp. NCCP-2716]
MDSIEKRLKEDLDSISFSDDRRTELIRTVKSASKRRGKHPVWRYRVVFAASILLALVLAAGGLRKPDSAEVHQASDSTADNLLQLLGYDSVKAVLLVLLFISVYTLAKRSLNKRGKGLPVCPECGTVWSRKQALKKYWRGKKVDCPHCGTAVFLTRKSQRVTAFFSLGTPLLLVFSNLFENSLYGSTLYLILYFLLMNVLVPYYIDLQLEDPDKEPLW